MAAGRTRSTRKLCSWIVDQVNSGKYPGLVWDDAAKTMFRIPWKHAGKQDFRKDEDAAIFKAWAEFKGKLSDGVQDNPASWKTRLRCALNKSPEFMEVMERAQLDISDPYKVYRLVPPSEQGMVVSDKKSRVKAVKRPKSRRSSQLVDEDSSEVKIKKKEVTSPLAVESASEVQQQQSEILVLTEEAAEDADIDTKPDVGEIMLDVRIEESVPASPEAQDSFDVAVCYLGQEVLKRKIQGADIRIMYLPSSPIPPTPAIVRGRFPRILLPDPPSSLPAEHELFKLLPFMQQGVVLTSMTQGVYGKRFCRGRVFWTGPHTSSPEPQKMERNTDPVLLFSKDVFKQQLDHFRSNGGEPPQCGITLCFGEELSGTEDPSAKHIILKITFPWAEQQVQDVESIMDPITILQSLASQSPLGEITLNLVTVTSEDAV